MAKKHRFLPKQTRKAISAEKKILITQLKRLDYGHIQFTRMLSPISFVMAGLTLMKVYDISFAIEQIVILIVGALAAMYITGLIWDKTGLVEEEIEYFNERNRFVKAVLKNGWINKLSKATIRK
ncbi:MAG: hypothetical protein AABW84_00545 [Nanoarchaeota archaeon]